MSYDFDKIVNRAHTNSVKWDFVFQNYQATPREHHEDVLHPDNLLHSGLPTWIFRPRTSYRRAR